MKQNTIQWDGGSEWSFYKKLDGLNFVQVRFMNGRGNEDTWKDSTTDMHMAVVYHSSEWNTSPCVVFWDASGLCEWAYYFFESDEIHWGAFAMPTAEAHELFTHPDMLATKFFDKFLDLLPECVTIPKFDCVEVSEGIKDEIRNYLNIVGFDGFSVI